jgi:polysaccharide export outer membrane protein
MIARASLFGVLLSALLAPPLARGFQQPAAVPPEDPRQVEAPPPGDDSDIVDILRDLIRQRRERPRQVPAPDDPAEPGQPDPAAVEKEVEALKEVERLVQEVGPIEPVPPFEIPDPPPHEGALIDYSMTVEPPDLIVVEVLEALPGRPITGERLVRPDGTISLDFYGRVHVRGLSLAQIKTRITIHLRKHLNDYVLGLIDTNPETGEHTAIAPSDTDRVFVDQTSYNSKSYYVQGDVVAPGRLPFTGHETVLDALNYAAGLAPTADPKAITLVRPARGNSPTRTYPIDLEAIRERGDPAANLQIFPGDRLIVGRHATVQATIAVDRVSATVSSLSQMILTLSSTVRSLKRTLADPQLTPSQRQAVVDAWVELAWPIMTSSDVGRIDKEKLRAILRRGFIPEAPAEP